jgi:hypothetical protein
MCVWVYRTIYGCRPEMELKLPLVPAVLLVLYTISLRVWITARW